MVVARLSRRWTGTDIERLSTTLDPRGSAQTLIVDRDGVRRTCSLIGRRVRPRATPEDIGA